ncbi:hypothetical protein FRC03_000437 [Tulasnella sp. 419]|nr:hypothetical protein FRC03_000437 [Tulasnella sp. 419]
MPIRSIRSSSLMSSSPMLSSSSQDSSDSPSKSDSGQSTPRPGNQAPISLESPNQTRQGSNSPTADVILFKSTRTTDTSAKKTDASVASAHPTRVKKPRPLSHPPSIPPPSATTPIKSSARSFRRPSKELALLTPPNSDSKASASRIESAKEDGDVGSEIGVNPPFPKLEFDDAEISAGIANDEVEDGEDANRTEFSRSQSKEDVMPVIMPNKELQSTMPDPLYNPNNTTNVYINGLRPFFSQAELVKLASMFGKVLSCRVFHRFNHNTRGQADGKEQPGSTYAFVLYSSLEDAERCIKSLLKYSDLHPSFARTQRLPGSRGGLISESLEAETLLRSAEKVAATRDLGSSTSSSSYERTSTEVLIQGLPRSATREVVESLLRPHVAQDIRLLPLGTESSNDSRLVAYVRLPSQQAVDETIERLHNRSVAGWTDRDTSVKLHVVVTNPVEAQIPTPPSSAGSTSQFSIPSPSAPPGLSRQLDPPFELGGMQPWMNGIYGGPNHLPPYAAQFNHQPPSSSSNSPPQPFAPNPSATTSTPFPSRLYSTLSPFGFMNRMHSSQPPNIPIHQYPILKPSGVQYVPSEIPLGGLPLPPSYYNIPGIGLGGEQHPQYQESVSQPPPSSGIGMGQNQSPNNPPPPTPSYLQSPFSGRFPQPRPGMNSPHHVGFSHHPSSSPAYGQPPYQAPMRRFYPRGAESHPSIPSVGVAGRSGFGSHVPGPQAPFQVGDSSVNVNQAMSSPDHASNVPDVGGYPSSSAHQGFQSTGRGRWKGKAKA